MTSIFNKIARNDREKPTPRSDVGLNCKNHDGSLKLIFGNIISSMPKKGMSLTVLESCAFTIFRVPLPFFIRISFGLICIVFAPESVATFPPVTSMTPVEALLIEVCKTIADVKVRALYSDFMNFI